MERSAEINQFESLNGAARGADDEEERLSSSPLPSLAKLLLPKHHRVGDVTAD